MMVDILMLDNASPIEIAWTLITGGASIFALWNTIDALRDLSFWNQLNLSLPKDSDTRTIIISRIRGEVIKLYVLSCFCVIGAMAMFSPNPVSQQNQFTQLVAGIIFISIAIIKSLDSVLTKYETYRMTSRKRIRERLDRIMKSS